MLRNMVSSLMEHGRIVTTVPRAKELRRLADKMVSLAKDGGLHARREALSVITRRDIVDKLFQHWRQQFENRNGGYSRLVRIGQRRGDAAMLTVVELAVDSLKGPKTAESRPLKKKKASAAEPASPALEPQHDAVMPASSDD